MQLRIRHRTEYLYDQPVSLEPQVLRLTPRAHPCQTLLDHKLTITPEPAGMSGNLERDGSLSKLLFFNKPCTRLEIESLTTMELKPMNPFDFIVHPFPAAVLPMRYPAGMDLGPVPEPEKPSPSVEGFARETADAVNGNTVDFLVKLCERTREAIAYEARPEGEPLPPEKTLSDRKGSCRDLVVLAMAAARSLGLACRFVSGYCFQEDNPYPADLHAWMEVYLPGGGWRGFDPTLGLACRENHIALASGHTPAQAAPVQGNYRGSARSEMKVSLEFETADSLTK